MVMNYRDRSNQVPTMMKTRYENYVTDHIDAIYAENETDLS